MCMEQIEQRDSEIGAKSDLQSLLLRSERCNEIAPRSLRFFTLSEGANQHAFAEKEFVAAVTREQSYATETMSLQPCGLWKWKRRQANKRFERVGGLLLSRRLAKTFD